MQTAPETAEAALARLHPQATDWVPLPGGRSNRLWRVGPLVLKCFDPTAASPLFPNDAHAEARALSLLAPHGLSPLLRASGPDWVIYDHAEGPNWSVEADPAPLARMLHRLHVMPLPADTFRPLPNGSRAILAHAARFAPDGLPPPPALQINPTPPRPVHADPVLGNILATSQGPLLIDWQCPGMGDPAEDLSTLLSPGMMWLYTGRNAPEGWAERLLQAYPDRAIADRTRLLLPLYRWRIMAHCAWKAAQGDADYARALRIELETP